MTAREPMKTRILRFIVAYRDSEGFPPSVREIGAEVGLVSTSSVVNQLQSLECDGAIHRGVGPRMIKVLVEPDPVLVEPEPV
jgi:repressor LexA